MELVTVPAAVGEHDGERAGRHGLRIRREVNPSEGGLVQAHVALVDPPAGWRVAPPQFLNPVVAPRGAPSRPPVADEMLQRGQDPLTIFIAGFARRIQATHVSRANGSDNRPRLAASLRRAA